MLEIDSEILKRVDSIAHSLGTTTKEILPKIARDVRIEGIISVSIAAACLAIAFACVVTIAIVLPDSSCASYRCPDWPYGLSIVCGIVCAVAVIAFFANMLGLRLVLASEAVAIQRLIKMVRG